MDAALNMPLPPVKEEVHRERGDPGG